METDEADQKILSKLWAKTEPYHPLYAHLIDVGEVVAAQLAAPAARRTLATLCAAANCDAATAQTWLPFLAALHDLGKASPAFQRKGPPELTAPLEGAGLPLESFAPHFRHEALSAAWVGGKLQQDGWARRESLTIAAVLRGHHGDYSQADALPEQPAIGVRWEPLRIGLAEILRLHFAPERWVPKFSDHSVVGALFSGLLIWSDWLASNPDLFEMNAAHLDPRAYASVSRDRARAAVAALGLDAAPLWTESLTFAQTWPGIKTPRPVQAELSTLCQAGCAPGLAIIEAPMGEGKSEAALYLATQWLVAMGSGGIYVALPTAATSNQMFGRVRDFVASRSLRAATETQLVHGTAHLLDNLAATCISELSDDDAQAAQRALEWFRPRKRSLLAPYGVGTVDQAMMAALHIKFGVLRLFGLSNKVLIVDEVHAYDAYMSSILHRLLNWCRALRVPVILLSATLPAARRESLLAAYRGEGVGAPGERTCAPGPASTAPYPLITMVNGINCAVTTIAVPGAGQRLQVRLSHHDGLLGDPQGIARLAQAVTAHGGCCCVLANTVDSAQRIYAALKAELVADQTADRCRTLLFHARFPIAKRQHIEATCLDWFDRRSLLPSADVEHRTRPDRAILVATQVVEQSLDLDFDVMITEAAPIDLLLQRAGRLHRHSRGKRPTGPEATLHVAWPAVDPAPEFGASGCVYAPFLLLGTMATLRSRPAIDLPEDIRDLVETVYPDIETTPVAPEGVDHAVWEGAAKELRASLAIEADQARDYLIPPVAPTRFSLADQPGLVWDDDETDTTNYFTARTRLSDTSRQLLLLDGDEYAEQLTCHKAPPRSVLQALMLRTARVPGWWLTRLSAAPGFAAPQKPPAWLPGTTVLRLTDGCWRGLSEGRRAVTIRDDSELGVIRSEEEE